MDKKNTVLMFNSARQHSFSANADCLVTLNPGSNVVSSAKFNALTSGKAKSPPFIDMIDAGEIEVIDNTAVEKAVPSKKDSTTGISSGQDDVVIAISKLGAREAVSVIKSELDVEVIKNYLLDEETSDNDPRPSVVKAANEAIKALEASSGDGE